MHPNGVCLRRSELASRAYPGGPSSVGCLRGHEGQRLGWGAETPLDGLGRASVADFGFANRYSLKNSLMSTFCGSVAYTAPEILMSKKYNGELADLWSL